MQLSQTPFTAFYLFPLSQMNPQHLRELAYLLAQAPEAREFTRLLDTFMAAQSMNRCVRLQEETLDDPNQEAYANEPLEVSFPDEP